MSNILKQLQVGQTVGVHESDTGFQLTLLASEQPGQAVVEVGADYVVLEDAAAGVKTRIPCHYLTGFTNPAETPAVVQVEPVPQAA